MTPSATGSHIVVVTDGQNRIGETDENNNRLSAASEVTPRAADLEVVDIQVPTDARSGEEATIRFTIENSGDHPVWSGTDYWTDYVWISADVQFIRNRASYFGQAVRSNASPLAPGEQYTVEMTGTLPEGIGGDFFVYIHPDTHNRHGRTVDTSWWPAEYGRNEDWLEEFSRWAFEDPRNNVLAAPMPVQYYEPDLVVSDPVVPAGVTSGQNVTIEFAVTNEGTRATRTDRWVDRVFLSKDPSLDRFDTMIGEFERYERDDFLEIGESYIAAVDARIPDGIDGDFYVLMLTDSPASPDRRIESNIGFKNQGVKFEDPNRLPDGDELFETQRLLARGKVLEYQLEGNNTIATMVGVTLAATPDLQVTEVVAPERVRAGQPFDVTYTVQNFGGDTPVSQSVWNDLVYLSRDRFLDLRADRFLGTVRHEDGLSAGVTYSETQSYRAPSGFADETEEYYVFVVTDPARNRPTGDVFELGAETNNDRPTVAPVIFELPPPTDLQVTAVTVPQTARSGEAVNLSWTVHNTSNEPAVGSWSDTLYLSSDATWDISDVPLGRVAFSGTLAPDETYSQTLDTLLPPATPGQYRVITRTDIFNQVYEREFDANNALASSETLSVTVEQLQLGTPFDTTLSTGQSRLFQVTVPHDQTLRVSLSTEAAGASNEIFLRYDAAPTIADFDAAYEGGLDSNLQAVIPSTEPGTYYVLIRGFSQPEDDTPVRLFAELLPLVITDVNTDVGGDSKFVTTKIEGARFDEDAIVKLIRPGFAEFVPVVYEVVDSTKILATFDFTDAPHGLYDVTVINPGDEAAVVPYRFLVEQAVEPDVTIGVGGPRTILAGDMGTYSVALQSVSNLDTPYVHFEVGIPEMLTNQYVYGLPFVRFNSNVRGAPDGADDVPWAQINSVINAGDTLGGTVRSPGYLFDQDANGFTGFSFNLSTYPGLEQMHDRAWEELVAQIYAADPELEEEGVLDDGPDGLDQIYDGLTDIYNSLAAVPSECEIPFIPFRFHLVAAATAMTREEFIEHSLGEAETLRQAIIDDDSSVTPALTTLAANRDDWGNLFLAALEQGGLLRDVDDIPPIRQQEKIISLMGTLSSGILIGPAGQEVKSSGNLLEFFEQVRQWYGHDPNQMGEVEFYDPRKSRCQEGEIPVPAIAEFEDYDLGLSQRTHFESFRVYVPWMGFEDRGAGLPPEYQINGPQPVDGDEFAGLDLTQFLDGDAVQGLASITGPQTLDTAGWLPLAERLPYSVSFANSPEASQFVQEVRVVTQLDEDLDIYSFRLGDINIGKIDVNIPSDRALFQGEFDFTESEGFILRVSAGIDQFSREASWLLQAIDPLTGHLLQVSNRVLLAPNNAQGDGDAFVSYTILPDADVVETGSEISASARVLFNNAPPEETPVITQPVDAVPPSTVLTVAPVAGQDANYLVDWSATDDPDGSGLRHVTLYVATDGGDYKIWQRQLAEASGPLVFEGEAGSTYEFLALAADTAGNRETPGLGKTAEGDGTTVNLGAAPSVPDTTPPNFGIAPEPSPEPSTSPLFVTAEQLIPAAEVSFGRPEFDQVLRPFLGKSFVTGIEQSFAEIGPMAIAETPDGEFIVSGGTSRSSLFRFGRDGGEALNAWAELPYPIFNLAFDGDGRLWAATGGGPLLELDPDTGAILAEHGEGITMALAIDPVSSLIYAASGAVWSGGVNGQSGGAGGVQIFDPVTETFTQFSRDLNLRAASLAFDPQGNLWATTWPDRTQVVRFTPERRGELMLDFDAPVDSLAFGQPGTELEGLMFVSHNEGGNEHPGSELTMIDLATLRRVSVADGGTRGDVVVTTSDGRVLVSQSNQVDVLNPAVAPLVIATNPPTDGITVLPISTLTVTFDQQMYTGVGGEPHSVLNPDNFVLVGDTVGEVSLSQVIYIGETNTAHLLPGGLEPDTYTLTVQSDVISTDQLKMEQNYATTFTAVQDFSAFVDIRFDTVRSDRAADTVSWDVVVTNTSDFDLQLPVLLILDPADGYPGVPQDAMGQSPDGRWYVELSSTLLQPGDSTLGQTVTVDNENDRRVDLGTGVAANPGANQPPVFETDPPTVSAVGASYEYEANAIDADGVALQYFLFSGPEGMQVDPDSGLVTWNPTDNASQTTPVELHAYDTRGGRAVQRFEIVVTGGNRAPVLNELPSLIEGREGEPIEFPLSVTDFDGDPLAAWVDQLPPGAVLDPVTLTFRWTPDFDSAGTYRSVAFNVSDGIHTVTASTSFAIAPGDQPPTLVLPPDRIVREGDRIRMAIRGFDPDGGSVEFSSHLLPPGARLHPSTGVFDWTPDFFMHRDEPYEVPITVTSGEVSVTETMSITVINANGAPVFDDLTGWRIFESQPMAFSAFAYDPDNPGHEPPVPNESGGVRERTPESPATVSYSVEGLPPGASFDPITTLFFWQPEFDQAGSYELTVTATDDGNGTGMPLSVESTVSIEVMNLNRAPEIDPIDNQTVARDNVREIPVNVTDPDGNPLLLSAENAEPGFPLPNFVTFTDNGDGTGLFRLTPTVGDRGDYGLTVLARDDGDGGGRWAEIESAFTFIATVDSPNEPPRWEYIGDKVAVAGEPFELTVRAVDRDEEPLDFDLSGLPAAATITPDTTYGSATIRWTPQTTDIGVYTATVNVDDGGNGQPSLAESDASSFSLVVRAGNATPNLSPLADRAVDEGETLSLLVAASDADGDPLTYRGENLPEGATIDPATGQFTWTPSYQQAGLFPGVRVVVGDGHRSRFQEFNVSVANTNRGPVIVPREPLFMREGGMLEFAVEAGDIDGDPLSFSATGLPNGAEFSEDGRFRWTPGYEQAGEYVVTFTATDPSGLSDSTDVTLRIDNINRAPELDTSFHAVRLGEELRFNITATDPDLGTTLTYDATDLPEGATVDPASGEVVWTPGPGQDGEYLVRVFASDGQTATSQIIVILAAVELPSPEVSVVLTPSFPSPPGEIIQVAAIADSLADIASLAVTLDGQPVTLDENGRGEISVDLPGRYEVVATARDLDGLVGVAGTILKVRDPADVDAPLVELDAPEFQILSDGLIRGTISDLNLDEWTLEMRRVGESEFVTIAVGNDPIVDGVLATVDPRDLPNDYYELRLSARDIGRRLGRAGMIVELYSESKNNVIVSEIDLTAEVGGVTVDVGRQYDSIRRGTSGDFGNGWRMLNREVNFRASVRPTGFESQGLYSAYRSGTRLLIDAPSGEQLGFVFEPVAQSMPGFTYYTAAWQPLATNPVGWTLESPELTLIRGGDQFFALATGYPYNPSSPLFPGDDFRLVAPDATGYDIDAQLGITRQTDPSGATLYLGDSGVVATGGESIQLITDGSGRVSRVVGPAGEIVEYRYDASGNLVSVRRPDSGQTRRYGYSGTVPGRLELAVGNTSGGLAFEYPSSATPVTSSVEADLGAAASYTGQTLTGDLAAGETQRFAFSVRQSELDSTSTGELLVRIVARTSGGSQVEPPEIPGLVARSTHSIAGRSEAVYSIGREGLYQFAVSESGGTSGTLNIELMVAGDVNQDLTVDGLDSDAVAASIGLSEGDAGYDPRADVDGSGTIEIDDRFLLLRNSGFVANAAPAADPAFAGQVTHVNLALQFALTSAVIDSDGDQVNYRLLGAQNGSVTLSPDGTEVTFVPDPGFTGAAAVELVADDGFNPSSVITLDINVSDAELLDIEIVSRQPALGIGDRSELLVLGDFADQQDVPLIGDYLSYFSTDPSVLSVDGQGKLFAAADGYAAITVSRGDLNDATAATVGTPFDELNRDDGIFVYPGSLTLPLVSGQRQFLVETLDGETDLSSAESGVLYVLGDSRVVDLTENGLMTSSALGSTTLTIISGPAEVTVPIRVIEPEIGSATFGSEGGLLQSSDGTQLQIPPGALPDGVQVSLDPLPIPDAADLPRSEEFTVGRAFQLDFSGQRLEEAAQLAVPVGTEFQEGDTVYFMQRQELTDIDGSQREFWLIVETGIVGSDGFARTTSPPYPGFSAGGQYIAAKSDQPEKLVTIGGPARNHEGFSLALDWNNGIGVTWGGGFIPIIPALTPVITIATYRRNPLTGPDAIPVQQLNVDVSAATPGQVFTPAVSFPVIDPADSAPVITNIQLTSVDPPVVQLTGQRFAGSEVIFRYRGNDISAGVVSSDTSATVPVPAGVIAGLADILIKHPVHGESNASRLTSPGGLGAVGRTGGGIAVFDTNTNTNSILKEFNFGGGSDTIFTTDLTRLYAATFRHGIGVVDTITLKQMPPISLPGNAFHHQITTDPGDRFLFVGGPTNTLYIVDIRPESPTFHQTISSIVLPRERVTNSGIAVNADGTKLLVGSGTEYDDGYLTVFELDWDAAPTGTNPSSAQFATLLSDQQVAGIPLSVNATSDPDHATITYRYQVSSYTPWGGNSRIVPYMLEFGAVTLTDNGFSVAKVDTFTPGGLSPFHQSFPYSGYYTDIFTPRDVVVAPDLSAAFIANWEFLLISGYGGQRGDKVGVVSDPFGKAAGSEYLGSTTPIDFGCTTSVALNSDGSRVFASYGCIGETLVMDADALVSTGLSRSPSERERLPLDLVGSVLDPDINPGVHLTPISTGGLVQGLSTQGGDFFSVTDFGSGPSLDRVEMEYEVNTPLGVELPGPVEVTLRGIPQPGDGMPVVVGTIEIHPDNMGSGGLIELGDGEDASDALKSGTHKLILDPSQIGSLSSALENEDFELIQASADPSIAKFDASYDFAGYYQQSDGARGVLRTGSKTRDTVEIATDDSISWSSNNIHPDENTSFVSASDILIVTADKKDWVHALGDADEKTETALIVLAGLGNDFVIGGRGDDRLDAGSDTGTELFDFNVLVGMGGDDHLEGSETKDVMFGDGFELGVSDLESFAFDLKDGKFSTPSVGLIPVGNGEDTLIGNDGFDVMFGGHNIDTLKPGEGSGSLMFGDTFELSVGGAIDISPLYDFTDVNQYFDELAAVASQLNDFFSFSPEFAGAGADKIFGGGTFDMFFGGDGMDEIDVSASTMALGWGGPGKDTITGPKRGGLIFGDDLTPDQAQSLTCGTDCNDTITATPGSVANFFIAGEGDDTVTGGGRLDLIIGDGIDVDFEGAAKWGAKLKEGEFTPPVAITTFGSGNDKLDGGYDISFGIDFIVGGEGDDEIVGSGYLVGPGHKIQPSFTLKLSEMFNKKDTGDTQSSNDEQKNTGKKSKIFDYSLGFEYLFEDNEKNKITAVGPLSIVAGGKGEDEIYSKGYFAWIDGKDGNDKIDASESIGNWIEGGKGDDEIKGANQTFSIGSVIFGDEMEATVPLNPASLLSSIDLGINFEWGKEIKVSGGLTLFKMSGDGKDTIHTGGGAMNFAAGGGGEDEIYVEGEVNVALGDSFNLALAGEFGYDFEKNEVIKELTLPTLEGVFNDKLYGTTNSIDVLVGGGGDDTLSAVAPGQSAGVIDIDVMYGNDGKDTITGGQGLNLLVGGDGDDSITADGIANFLIGDGYSFAAGNPLALIDELKAKRLITAFGFIPAGSGEDRIISGDGLDLIIGGDKKDLIAAGNGFNVVFGDELTLAAGFETDLSEVFDDPSDATEPIEGGLTGSGDDVILGGSFVDVFFGGDGDDDLRAYGGIDLIFGNHGADTLCGGPGNDILLGGAGNDWLDGGPNTDVHQGDDGADSFVFDNPDDERDSFWNWGDWISDYDPATGDVDVSGTLNNRCFIAFDGASITNYFPIGSSLVTDVMRQDILADLLAAIVDAETQGDGEAQWVSYNVDASISTIGGANANVDNNGGNLLDNRMNNVLVLEAWLEDQVEIPVELIEGVKLVGGPVETDQNAVLRDGMIYVAADSAPDPLPAQLGFQTLDVGFFVPSGAEEPSTSWSAGDATSWNSQSIDVDLGTGSEQPAWLMSTVEVAQQRWVDAVPEVTSEHFENVEYAVRDLPGTVLGQITRSGDVYQIGLDANAAGVGWFIDSTPHDDDEFVSMSGAAWSAPSDSPASGIVDLLTVIQHEIGHILGLPDLAAVLYPDSLMTGTLSPGVRRIPTWDDVVWSLADLGSHVIEPGDRHLMHMTAPTDVVNGRFEIADPADPDFGWTTRGAATVAGGVGRLEEDATYNSGFSQAVEIPGEATVLRFTVTADFGFTPGEIGDAFEFALIDAHTAMPLLGSAMGLTLTDAAVNVQRDGTTYLSPVASVDAGILSSETLDLSVPHTFRIDLTGLTESAVAMLHFDLIGLGELDSAVTIDDVVLEGLLPPDLDVQLDPFFDTGGVGDDVTFLTPIDLVGTTEAGIGLSIDLDGDGTADRQTTADFAGQYRFAGISLGEGPNTFTVSVTNSQGTTEQPITIIRDTAAPEPTLGDPLPNELINASVGTIEVDWNEIGSGIDPTTIDPGDVTVTGDSGGVFVDAAEWLGGGRARYSYSGDLPEGAIVVAFQAGAVGDLAGNTNAAGSDSFRVDTLGPVGELIGPGSVTDVDLGHVDIQWDDIGLAGLDLTSIGPEDLAIPGVTFETAQHLGGGLVRYTYSGGGDALTPGEVAVTRKPGEVRDLAGNPSAGGSSSFVFEPPVSDPLKVDRVQVNDGDAQRSNIESITIFFNKATNLGELIGNAGILDAVQVYGSSQVLLDATRYQYDSATNALMIDLTDDGFGGSRSTMLADGRYQIRMDTTKISGASGGALLDDDAVDDAIRTFDYHRLLGDFDGDADVDVLDRNWFFSGIGASEGDANYKLEFDLTEDGTIDMLDYRLWLSQYRKRL